MHEIALASGADLFVSKAERVNNMIRLLVMFCSDIIIAERKITEKRWNYKNLKVNAVVEVITEVIGLFPMVCKTWKLQIYIPSVLISG